MALIVASIQYLFVRRSLAERPIVGESPATPQAATAARWPSESPDAPDKIVSGGHEIRAANPPRMPDDLSWRSRTACPFGGHVNPAELPRRLGQSGRRDGAGRSAAPSEQRRCRRGS